jgi:hypothetical protein
MAMTGRACAGSEAGREHADKTSKRSKPGNAKAAGVDLRHAENR